MLGRKTGDSFEAGKNWQGTDAGDSKLDLTLLAHTDVHLLAGTEAFSSLLVVLPLDVVKGKYLLKCISISVSSYGCDPY